MNWKSNLSMIPHIVIYIFYKTRMNNLILLTFFLFFSAYVASGQKYSGLITEKATGQPISYVNLGVMGKNLGTVSDQDGKYTLKIDTALDKDTLRVSCIGFYPFTMNVSDFRKLRSYDIRLEERIFEVPEIIITPKKYQNKILGVSTKFKAIQAGFKKENQLGYECGILMKIKKSALLEKLIINFAYCTYDTIFYRINIYRVNGKMDFENIMQNPIYLKLPRESVSEQIEVDLTEFNITVYGDILVTLEHIKDLGEGHLLFCAGFANNTYYRRTSQASWEKVPIGISISMAAMVEK